MAIEEGRSRREAFRQDELLAMKEEMLTPEQFEAELNGTGIVSQHTGLEQALISNDSFLERSGGNSKTDPEVAAALEALEMKLNYLISMNLEKSSDSDYEQRLVNLSATGIGFVTQLPCNQGDRLKVKMSLPMFPPVRLELLGEVMSVSSADDKQGGYRIGVSFIYRCAQEEEAIVKYLFKRQRERIRIKHMADANEADEELSGSGI